MILRKCEDYHFLKLKAGAYSYHFHCFMSLVIDKNNWLTVNKEEIAKFSFVPLKRMQADLLDYLFTKIHLQYS